VIRSGALVVGEAEEGEELVASSNELTTALQRSFLLRVKATRAFSTASRLFA
jgi:hypothetical protein